MSRIVITVCMLDSGKVLLSMCYLQLLHDIWKGLILIYIIHCHVHEFCIVYSPLYRYIVDGAGDPSMFPNVLVATHTRGPYFVTFRYVLLLCASLACILLLPYTYTPVSLQHKTSDNVPSKHPQQKRELKREVCLSPP